MANNATSVGAVALDMRLNTSGLTAAINAAAQQAGAQLNAVFRQSLVGCENTMAQIGRDISQTMQTSTAQISQAVSNATRQAGQSINSTNRNLSEAAQTISNPLTSAVKKLAKDIASAFAVRQVVRFTQSCVEAAAQVKALNAQITQTFKTLEGDARNAISAVAAESGILDTRLQGLGSQMYAFALAAGMDGTTALNMMRDALQVTADSAAFYDKSLETVGESLRSFLKGNYANDAALGISCTETTRNIAANKLYGKSFKDLSEAQKQLTLLQMVKDANKLSGAMGQAAREADGWENVTGNLKESWKQLKAAIGMPLLQALTPVVQKITAEIQRLTEAATAAAQALSELFGWDLSIAENTGGAIAATAENVKEAEEKAGEEIEKTAQKAKGSLAGFDKLNVLSQEDKEDKDDNTDDSQQLAGNAQAAEKSITGLKNELATVDFSEIKKKAEEIINFFKPLTDSVGGFINSALANVKGGVSGFLNEYSSEIERYSGSIKSHLLNTVEQTRNGLTNITDEASASQERMGDKLSQGYADILGGASIFSLSFIDTITGMLDVVSEKFELFTIENKGLIGEFFDGINGNFANLLSTVGGILEDIGTRLTEWWEETGSEAFGKFTAAIFDIIAVVLDLWKSYVSPFIDYIIDSVGTLWDEHIGPLWSGILEFISSLWEAIAAIWDGLLRPLYDTFIKRIMVGILGVLKSLWDIIMDVFGIIVDVVRGVIRIAQGLLDFITGIFTGDIEKAVKGIAEFIHGICIIVWSVIKGALNLVIDALNTVWSALYGVLKSIVDGVGDFVGAIGDVFGQDWGFSLPDEVPRIPRLAQGGVAYAPTLAVIGDNPNARNDPEVVSPLSKLNGMIGAGEANDAMITRLIAIQEEILAELRIIAGKEFAGKINRKVLFRAVLEEGSDYKRTHNGRSAFV